MVQEPRRNKQQLPPVLPDVPGWPAGREVAEEVRASSGGLVRPYVAEQSGLPLSSLIYDNQPGEEDHCGSNTCNPCEMGTTRKKNCRKVTRGGLVYSCRCLTCEEEGRQGGGGDGGGGGGGGREGGGRGGGGGEEDQERRAYYHGECKKTLHSRQGEHFKGLEGNKEINPLFKHETNQHEGTRPRFEFKVEKFFTNSMDKGIFEGVSINRSPSSPGLLMNSKAEYRQREVARVVMVRGLGE